jgi:hypothetical protein
MLAEALTTLREALEIVKQVSLFLFTLSRDRTDGWPRRLTQAWAKSEVRTDALGRLCLSAEYVGSAEAKRALSMHLGASSRFRRELYHADGQSQLSLPYAPLILCADQ